jgi:hypothetical protein
MNVVDPLEPQLAKEDLVIHQIVEKANMPMTT